MKKILGIVLAIVLLVNILPLGSIVQGGISTSVVAQTTSVYGVRISSQHGAFYAEGRYWVFYLDTSDDFCYKSSTDGESWSSPTSIAAVPFSAGALYDVVFDGTHVHYIRNTDYDASRYKGIAYRRGTPQSDGSISWCEVEQTVLDGAIPAADIQLAVDSNGYPWIGYAATNSYYPAVIKSSNNDGTWSTTSGFPYTFFETVGWFVIPVAQTTGKVYCIIYRDFLAEEVIKGYQWDGDSWESEQDATTSDLSSAVGSGFFGMLSVVANGDDIHLVLLDTSGDILHVIRSSGSWGTETTVEDTTLAAYSSPVLTKTGNGNLICYWLHSDDKSYYKKYIDGSWDASPTELTDETSDTFTAEYNIQAYYEDCGGKYGLLYQTGGYSDYNIVHVAITFPPSVETDACSDATASSLQLNGDILDAGGLTITRRGFYYTTVFDDFEWGVDKDPLDDDGGWIDWTISVAGDSKAEIDEAQHYEGTRSARIYKDGVSATPHAYFSQPAGTDYIISVWVKSNANTYVGVWHGDGTKLIRVKYIDADLKYYDGVWKDTGVDIGLEWALLEIQGIDWNAGTYDIYHNGILAKSGATMQTSSSFEDIISIRNAKASSECWFDDVGVWYEEDESDSFGEGEYDLEISGLDPVTSYKVMAFAENEAGIGYGDVVECLTCPAAPTNVVATDGDHTDKVVITWTGSEGATGYKIYRDGGLVDTLGDVETYDDTEADAPTITAGSTVASDGSSTAHVALELSGTVANNGTEHTYKVKAYNDSGDSPDSDTDTGYRGHGALTYQWQRSSGDADSDYSNIDGATDSTYEDTDAPKGIITSGNAVATDGASTAHVSLSIEGNSKADGAGRYYQCILNADGAVEQTSASDRGYRTIGDWGYQWLKSSGDYNGDYTNIDGATSSTHDDAEAPAGNITAGSVVATDGDSPLHVALSLSGTITNDGDGRYYECLLSADGADSQYTVADRGYRTVGALSYQWQRSTTDSDADYGNIGGATASTYNDEDAPAPTVTPGTASASDSTSTEHVTLSLASEMGNNGEGRYFQCVLDADGAVQQTSSSNRGYRGTDTLSYQWQRSEADSDAVYSNIVSATTDPYNDTEGVVEPDGRYYLCTVNMTGAVSQNSTTDRGCKLTIVAPNVTAHDTTGITGMSGIIHGEIVDTGNENPDTVGFEWGYSAGNYSHNWTDTGDFSLEAFSHTISGFSTNTTVFWRAFAINSGGTGYSGAMNFTTLALPLAPTNFTITQIGYNSYNISWTMGLAANTTIVRASEAGYPDGVTGGYPIYSGNSTWVIVTGLDPNMTTYYYRAWSHNDYGYSLDYAEATLGNELGIAQLVFVIGLFGFALWKKRWIRVILSLCVIMWGAFAMPYDVKIAAPLVAVGTILFFISILNIIKGGDKWSSETPLVYRR